MLHHLRVVNLGVIEDSSIELTPGLNVITGETGAGKTLLLGGLRLLVGEKADASLVGVHSDESRAEGLFGDEDNEIAVARALPAGGRSRAYADGVLVSASVLADAVGPRVEIIGQHDQLTLRKPGAVLELVDAADPQGVNDLLGQYREAWEALREAEKIRDSMGGDGMGLRRELDLVAFQADEIARETLRSGEDQDLEGEASRLRNLEAITLHLADTTRLLDQISEAGGETVARMRKVADLDPSSRHLARQAELLAEGVNDLAREVAGVVEGLEGDPGRLDEVERRLNTLGDLKRKYGRTIEDVIAFGYQARARAGEIARIIDRADAVEGDLTAARAAVIDAATDLSSARRTAADRLAARALAHLADLGMGSPRLEVRLEPADPGPSGADRAAIWFSSDPRLDMAPVGTGASGGELSRLVLAVRLAASRGVAVTLVFDEVDTGIGGTTALAMGRKLAELASEAQVVCVTHLPQVAAHADTHFVVKRDGDTAVAGRVEGEERVQELTRMLAGLPESEAGHQAASELLHIATRV